MYDQSENAFPWSGPSFSCRYPALQLGGHWGCQGREEQPQQPRSSYRTPLARWARTPLQRLRPTGEGRGEWRAFVERLGLPGLTPLHLAVARHPDKIAALLDAGANPNAKTPGGLTPLHLAAQSGSYDVVVLLLSEGADPLATLSNDKTALHVLYSPSSCTSCERKEQQEVSRKEIATRFVKAGVSPDTRDTAGASALHYAAMRPDAQEATVELLSLGADPRTRDHEGVPVSFYASLAGNTAAAELTRLAAADSVNTVDPEGKTKEEWISAKRREMDASRYSSKPEIITGPAAFAAAGVRFEYGCHYWLGMGCAVVGTIACYVGCSFITGPFAFLCGPLCSVGAYAGCWEAVELICGPG